MTGDRLAAELVPPQALGAQLDPGASHIEFAAVDGQTYVRRQQVGYPLHIGRVLHVADDPLGMATLYLQSSSGGLFEHDRVRLSCAAGAATRTHLTSAASTIVHSMQHDHAEQEVVLHIAPGAWFEYLPEASILFAEARLRSRLRVVSSSEANVMLCDSYLMHDPYGSGKQFDWLQSEVELHDETGKLLMRDRYRISGTQMREQCPGVVGAHSVLGSFFLLGRAWQAQSLATLRAALAEIPAVYAGVTALPHNCGLLARGFAQDGVALRAMLRTCWAVAREQLTGQRPAPRRK